MCGGDVLEKSPHLVNWTIFCLGKKNGSLEIHNPFVLNKTVLGKWYWRFATEREFLWEQVIIGNTERKKVEWCSRGVREGYGVGVWKVIGNEW